MFFWLADTIATVSDYMDTGGPVLWVIATALFIMWTFLLERIWYFYAKFPQEAKRIIAEWDARTDTTSWFAHRIREARLSEAEVKLNERVSAIKTLIAITPMMGLLGTVTGMVAVFESMATTGSSNARLMASGISMATIPTLSGMVCAVSGLFVVAKLESKAKAALDQLADHMPHH